MTGINTVILYSAKIFAYAGVDNPVAVTATIGLVNVLTTIVSIYLIGTHSNESYMNPHDTMFMHKNEYPRFLWTKDSLAHWNGHYGVLALRPEPEPVPAR